MFAEHEMLIGLDEFQDWTKLTDRKPLGVDGLGFVLLGLFGEVGSLLSELKKKQRDDDSYIAYHDSAIEELGDVLWYFANTAARVGLKLSTIAVRVPAKLGNWDYRGRPTRDGFADLQKPQAELIGPLASDLVEQRLLALAGRVGVLMDHYSTGNLDANGDAFAADLVEIFRAILTAADDASVLTFGLTPDLVDEISKGLNFLPVMVDPLDHAHGVCAPSSGVRVALNLGMYRGVTLIDARRSIAVI